MAAVGLWQHALHLEAQAQEIRRDDPAGMLRIEGDVDGQLCQEAIGGRAGAEPKTANRSQRVKSADQKSKDAGRNRGFKSKWMDISDKLAWSSADYGLVSCFGLRVYSGVRDLDYKP